ncbi:hypothetical protein HRbin17_01508 [bacterium HR17]|jgi:flagellar basal-body rod protein FlgB|uniref:Flagellar basal body rod protein FlgB n=1 Tax=Candidatus Fervidibacter japonicus TaxID=2035412 RepID=A0A2H5XCX6_9BACT|nr:hypothetical protein HRbin17_01508 [bacterium HR17]
MALVGLERALDVLVMRAQVLAGNLANASTPGYLRRDVPFYEAMRTALAGQPLSRVPTRLDMTSAVRGDGNNTTPEKELAALTETSLLYRTILQLTEKGLAQLQAAITEGRRV